MKALRLEAKLTQQDMSEKLGVSRPTYTYWEKGERTPPLETLLILANIFSVSLDYLLGNSNCRMKPNEEDCELGTLFESLVENMTEEEREIFVQDIADFMRNRFV